MENNLVCIVGVLDKEGSTNISQAKAFIELGYDVIPINYRTIINNYNISDFENLLISTLKKYRPFLTLFSKCNGIDSNIIKECSKYSNTWLWNMDPINTIRNCPEVLGHAKNADFSSCTGGGVSKWFESNGVDNCYTIFDGLDVDIFKPIDSMDNIKTDVSFIGSKTTEREEYKKLLDDANIKNVFYGNGFGPTVINTAFSQVCSSSKFMLSLNTYNDIPDYFSNRLLRYLGCGSCVLHYDPTNTIQNYFEDGKEIIIFRDKNELLDIIQNINADTAKLIGENGRKKVLKKFTWKHSMASIINSIRKNKIKKKILIKYHHGLGDIIALTPQLRYFYDNGYEIDLMLREESITSHLLDNCEYINEIIKIPNPWRGCNGLRTKQEYDEIEKQNTELMNSLDGYTIKLNVDHKDIVQNVPKTLFNSVQCDIQVINSYDKEVFIPKTIDDEVKKIVSERFPNGYVFVHTYIPNHPSHSIEITNILKDEIDLSVFDTSKEELNEDINYAFAYLKYASKIILSSSVMAQAAEALGKKMDILNFGNIDLKVLPNPILVKDILVNGKQIDKSTIYPKLDVIIDERKVLVTGSGRSGTNLTTEIIRSSDNFNFTEDIEDRNFFSYKKLPGRYATKLATENDGFNWKHIDRMMTDNPLLYVVFSSRHPVDLCMAKILRGQPSSQGGDGEDRLAPDASVNGSVKSIKKSYNIMKKLVKKYPHRVLVVKLEDLISDMKNEVTKICNFLNIPFSDNMLNAHLNNRNKNHQKRYGKDIDKSQVNIRDNWKTYGNGFFADKYDDIELIKIKTRYILKDF